jgi:hypothetical protein
MSYSDRHISAIETARDANEHVETARSKKTTGRLRVGMPACSSASAALGGEIKHQELCSRYYLRRRYPAGRNISTGVRY